MAPTAATTDSRSTSGNTTRCMGRSYRPPPTFLTRHAGIPADPSASLSLRHSGRSKPLNNATAGRLVVVHPRAAGSLRRDEAGQHPAAAFGLVDQPLLGRLVVGPVAGPVVDDQGERLPRDLGRRIGEPPSQLVINAA